MMKNFTNHKPIIVRDMMKNFDQKAFPKELHDLHLYVIESYYLKIRTLHIILPSNPTNGNKYQANALVNQWNPNIKRRLLQKI